ncbi:TPR-like protein [Sistotremastrum suecicum HHB10207 ss-3]|uniref:TPR-like protein n=1 Tax=Sistotremastrum suecicum HHB10207 ss-3 TaxID=1314776 RepID=A0A165ZZT8_9AGAM|nr:TPR-like protein [Sistotremastrum suecicum HHB10207 ss-3]
MSAFTLFEDKGSRQVDISAALRALRSVSTLSAPVYLQGISATAVAIYETAVGYNTRRQDATLLAERVVELTWAVCSSLEDEGQKIGQCGHFDHEIQHFLRTLEELARHLRKRSNKSRISVLLSGSRDRAYVRSLEEDLGRCLETLSLSTSMSNLRLSSSVTKNMELYHEEFERAMADAYEAQNQMYAEISPTDELCANISLGDLPPAPQVFFGRTSVVDDLVNQICVSEQSNVAILGAGGIGKTSVALSVLHHPIVVALFDQRRCFISCEASGNRDALLVTISQAIGLESSSSVEDIIRRLTHPNRPTLLVLDNLETPWEPLETRQEIENLLSTLSSSKNLSLLVTLRGAERPLGIKWTRPFLPPLPNLDMKSSQEIFVAISDVPEDDEYLPRLLQLLDCVPLAITLIANLAQHTSCDELFHRWKEERTGMLSRGFNDRDRRSSVDVSIQVSLRSERIIREPKALKVLQILSLLPDGVGLDDLPAMMRDPEGLHPVLSTLRQTSLIYEDRPSCRLKALSPIREYLQLQLPIDAEDLSAVQIYHFELAKTADVLKDKVKISTVHSQVGNISTVLIHSLKGDNPSIEAIETVLKIVNFSYMSSLSKELMTLAISAARRIGASKLEGDCIVANYVIDPEDIFLSKERLLRAITIFRELDGDQEIDLSIALALTYLGDCHRRLSYTNDAVACLSEAIEIYVKWGQHQRQVNAMRTIARAYEEKAQVQHAMSVITKALKLGQKHELPVATAHCYIRLGQIYTARCLYPSIEDCFKKAAELLEPIFGQTSVAYGMYLIYVGELYYTQGRLDQAEKASSQAYQIYLKLGRTDFMSDADWNLGRIFLQRGLLDKAMNRLQICLRRYRDLHWLHPQADCLLSISEIEFRRHNRDATFAHLMEARRCLKADKRTGFVTDAHAVLQIGNVYLSSGKLRAAENAFILACVIYRRCSHRVGVAEAIQKLGDVAFESDEMSCAKSCYYATLELIKHLGLRRNLSDCFMRLGDVLAREGGFREARTYYEKALSGYKMAECFFEMEECRERISALNADLLLT